MWIETSEFLEHTRKKPRKVRNKFWRKTEIVTAEVGENLSVFVKLKIPKQVQGSRERWRNYWKIKANLMKMLKKFGKNFKVISYN